MKSLAFALLASFLAAAIPAAATNTFPTTGNAGVGTTAPSTPLEVVSSSTVGIQVRTSTATAGTAAEIGFRTTTTEASTNYAGLRAVRTNLPSSAATDLRFFTYDGSTNTEKMTIMAGGNIGVGTTTPADKFVVVGTTTIGDSGLISLGDAVQNYNNVTTNSSGSLLIGDNLSFKDANTNSNVLVTPKTHGAMSGAGILIGGNAAANNGVNGNDIGFFTMPPASVTGGATYIASPALILKSSGNVGIGTANPNYPLTVNGTIEAKEVIVQTGWSDFVFAPNYRLAPLSEVDAAIKADHHLPGIPSAQQVAEHGISLGDMQARLLAKIEELTLRQIEQDKRIQRLEEENRQLRAAR